MVYPNDLIKLAEARRILGVSEGKVSQLVRDGLLRHYVSALDKRVKFVSRAEVQALKEVGLFWTVINQPPPESVGRSH
jgi:hypothetical protein